MWWESFMLIESAQMSHSLTWYDSLLEVGEVSPAGLPKSSSSAEVCTGCSVGCKDKSG